MDTNAILTWLREQREEVEFAIECWKPKGKKYTAELEHDLAMMDAIKERLEKET
jgi:hypothetical protein